MAVKHHGASPPASCLCAPAARERVCGLPNTAPAPTPTPPPSPHPPSFLQSVTLHTTLGDLKLELACDAAPAAASNFLAHAAAGTYDGTCFHRSVRGFVLQGGDPTGTGKGGSAMLENANFLEEAHALKHDVRGVVSVANGVPSRGLGSQFMITYAPQPCLDGKHVAFGRVIDGGGVLDAAERAATGERDRPVVDIEIKGVTIHANPMAG